MTYEHKRHLRHWLIYPRFQLVLIGAQAFVMIATIWIIQWENLQAFDSLKRLGENAGLPPDSFYFKSLTVQLAAVSKNIWSAFWISLFLSTLVTLYVSFKIAGPIYRIKKHFHDILESGPENVRPLKFRHGDFGADIPQLVNQAIKKVLSERKQ